MLNDSITTLGILIAGLLQVETEEALACETEQAPESVERSVSEWFEATKRSISPAA